MRHCNLILSAAFAIALVACTGGNGSDTPVPKPYAYPRIELMDTARTDVKLGNLNIKINAAAGQKNFQNDKLDVVYSPYGATLYISTLTTSDAAEIADIVDNRNMRFSLNLGGAPAKNESFQANGFQGKIIIAPEAPTPLQFLAIGDEGDVITGALVFAARTKPDSVAPVINAVHDDILYMLLNIERNGNN